MKKTLLAALVVWFLASSLMAGHTWFSSFGRSHFGRPLFRHSGFQGGFLFSGRRGFVRGGFGFRSGPRYSPYYRRGPYGPYRNYYPGAYYPQSPRAYSYSGPPSSYYYANGSQRSPQYVGYGSSTYQLQRLPGWATYGQGSGEVVQANYGDLVFNVEPDSALVYLDGKLIGSARSFGSDRDRYTILDGQYSIRIVLPGYEVFEADLQVVPNRTHYLDVELKAVEIP